MIKSLNMKILKVWLVLFFVLTYSNKSIATTLIRPIIDVNSNIQTSPIITNYLKLTTALSSDNNKKAAIAAEDLIEAFDTFDNDALDLLEQKEIINILKSATEQARQIKKNVKNIEEQRKYLAALSKDMVDLLQVTGTDRILYLKNCSGYNTSKSGLWLSDTKETRNPYYGSKMLKCGTVIKEI